MCRVTASHHSDQNGVNGHGERPSGRADHTGFRQDEYHHGCAATAHDCVDGAVRHYGSVARLRYVSQGSTVERQESRNQQQRSGGD